MTTYNSYEAAKIANPDRDVFTNTANDKFQSKSDESFFIRCLPSHHCMTVEKFLADGHKFVEGDLIYSDILSNVVSVTLNGNLSGSYSIYGANTKTDSDDKRLVLRAAALETKEPKRTKESYEKIEFKKVSDLVLACESGEVFYCENSIGDKSALEMYGAISMHRHSDSLFRRIETPIEWWEDAAEFMSELAELSITEDGDLRVMMLKDQIGFGMSRDKWCDFARILLEQGE